MKYHHKNMMLKMVLISNCFSLGDIMSKSEFNFYLLEFFLIQVHH